MAGLLQSLASSIKSGTPALLPKGTPWPPLFPSLTRPSCLKTMALRGEMASQQQSTHTQ